MIEVVPEISLPPVPTTRWARLRRIRRKHFTRRKAGAGALVAVVAAAGAVLGLALLREAGGTGISSESAKVALMAVEEPMVGDEDTLKPFVEGLLRAERTHGVTTETFAMFADGVPEDVTPSTADIQRLDSYLRSGEFDLVLWPGAGVFTEFLGAIPDNPDTRFALIDTCCVADRPLDERRNATGFTFRDDQAAHLVGYLSALMEERRPPARGATRTISVIGGHPEAPPVQALVRGFSAGARRAAPNVEVRVDYSYEFGDKRICEKLANEQIDAGSGVVFAAAGNCGLGALSAAAIRGVWGVGVDEDRSYLGPHILASAIKRWDRVVELSVGWFLEGRLPPGKDIVLGLDDDAVGISGISPEVPADIRGKVAREAARLRAIEVARKS